MRILTLSSVFPNSQQPLLGLFVLERTRFISKRVSVQVVAPIPTSPFDHLVRLIMPNFRPAIPGQKSQGKPRIHYPPFHCFPAIFKCLDGFLYFQSILRFLQKLIKVYPFELIDAHFCYPDGVAASLLSSKFNVPFTITLRGTEVPYLKSALRRWQMASVVRRASRVLCVSESLAEIAKRLGADGHKIRIVPNGVNSQRFRQLNPVESRKKLQLPQNALVLLSVGGLVERKGFHRTIQILPELKALFDDLVYVIVGGPSVEGDYSKQLFSLVRTLRLENTVRFEGSKVPDELPVYYSAADLFVLPTANEGWANVLLESMACGTPVVATDVGGNKEVVCRKELGTVVPFGDADALCHAISKSLSREWDQTKLAEYAAGRSWNKVADEVISIFREVADEKKAAFPRLG